MIWVLVALGWVGCAFVTAWIVSRWVARKEERKRQARITRDVKDGIYSAEIARLLGWEE